MAKSPSRSSAVLRVVAADPGTEIFVMNDRFERVAQGAHELDVPLEPGLYKVRFRAGTSMRDVLTELTPGTTPTLVTMGPLEFANAAPILATTATHEYQRTPAEELSRSLQTDIRTSSRLMLFVRDPQEGDTPGDLSAVEMRSIAGDPLTRHGLVERSNADQRFAGWNADVRPGTYRLRVQTGASGLFEMFVRAQSGWQTAVFLMTEDFPFGGQSVRRPALRSASILMCDPKRGFDPSDPNNRLAEQAKLALQYARPAIWGDTVRELVKAKGANPMLGIFGLHLGLLDTKPDRALLTTVVRNLAGMIPGHIDVDAARMDSRLPDHLRRRSIQFTTPPMLRSSWNLITHATIKQPSLVPAGSLMDYIAEWQMARGPWFLARVPTSSEPGAAVDGRYATERFNELCRAVNDSARKAAINERLAASPGLGALQRGLLGTATGWAEEAGLGARLKLKAPTVKDVVTYFHIPACTVARTSTTLLEWVLKG